MTDTYTPTRPIMGRDELAAHKVASHGRDYTVACDGYEDMEAATKEGWRVRSSWGRDGWDLGGWPFVSIQTKEQDGKFFVQQIVEGDHDVYAFDSEADQHAALDYLFLWYAAPESWAPLNPADRERLDAGGFEVNFMFRGPYRSTT